MQLSCCQALVAASTVMLGLSSCDDAFGPPAGDQPRVPPGRHATVFDAAHGGSAGFYFLAPLVAQPAPSGTFDPTVAVTVEICALAAGRCTARIATFTSSGPIGSAVILDPVDEHYSVLWHTDRTGADVGMTYRIGVLTHGIELGHADVVVVEGGREANSPSATEALTVVHGRTLPVKFRIEKGAAPIVRATIGAEGGTMHLPGYASFTVPADGLHGEQAVVLRATALAETDETFRETVPLPDRHRAAWELRLSMASAAPKGSLALSVEVTPEFRAALPAGSEPALWVQLHQDEGEDLLDGFVRLPGTLADGKIESSLPIEAFTDQRVGGEFHEAIVIVGAAPVVPELTLARSSHAAPMRASGSGMAATCEGSRLVSPLESTLTVTSRFGGVHKGADYRAANGDRLLAPAAGIVERIGWNVKHLSEPNRRSGLMVQGWGRYVRIRLDDGSAVLLAHLIENSTDHLAEGQRIGAGDFVGESDNTGGSTGPHLHMEHTLSGGTPVDPDACIDRGVADFSGIWRGSYEGRSVGPGIWDWDLVQEGSSVTGSAHYGEGSFSGTVKGNTMTLTISYASTGATNTGTATISGNTLAASLSLNFGGGGGSYPFTSTMTRDAAAFARMVAEATIEPALADDQVRYGADGSSHAPVSAGGKTP